MILFIILLSVLALSLIALIISNTNLQYKDMAKFEVLRIVSGISSALIGLAVSILGLYAFLVHLPDNQNSIRDNYETKVTELQSTYEILTNTPDSYSKFTLVQKYNSDVKELKTSIIKSQNVLKNPWINWLCPPIYNQFNPDIVSYIEL